MSEFGASVFSSFESLSPCLQEQHWGLHGGADRDNCTIIYENLNACSGLNPMAKRNYACDKHITAYFHDESLDEVGYEPFTKQLYQCLISQSLWMKGQIELHRNSNSFGLLIWQLNEIWPTGGWGLVEYGIEGNGQILGGRWKPLMHLLQRSLFRDVFATCGWSKSTSLVNGQRIGCYVRNDGVNIFSGHVRVEEYDLVLGGTRLILDAHVTLNSEGDISYFYPSIANFNISSNVLMVEVTNDEGEIAMGQNTILFSLPRDLHGLERDVQVSILMVAFKKHDGGYIEIVLIANKTALYVTLFCKYGSRFSDNAFAMRANNTKVSNEERILDTFLEVLNSIILNLFD